MIVTILLAGVAFLGLAFSVVLVRTAAQRTQYLPTLESIVLGGITNFFDTLGICSFAPTPAWVKLRRLVPDSYIPAVLNAGHCLPTTAQGLIFIKLVQVDPVLMASCIASAVVGSLVGAPIVMRAPVRAVRGGVGAPPCVAAGRLSALTNLALMRGGGAALALPASGLAAAVGIHFVL